MYGFLKKRVVAAGDDSLNVTHTMVDLEREFGEIDEATWARIN